MSHFRKQLLDQFSEDLLLHFSRHCRLYEQEENLASLLDFLIDQDLIPSAVLRKYTVIQEYDKLFPRYEKKTKTVSMLAARFNISERSIWLALKSRKEAGKL